MKKDVAEITLRAVLIAIGLTILLAMSNAYLALKLGILTSASIPAAIISMGILRFFKNSTIIENNVIQTAASAGEAVAGGIVYTIPALIIIRYWHSFDYVTNFFIAALGGGLGVLFSIPLRRILVNEPVLKFPEGRAIAEVLKSSSDRVVGASDIFMGGVVGAFFELLQVGFKLISNNFNYWFLIKGRIFGVGVGFSATMVGAGYLIGPEMAFSIFLGALISGLIVFPGMTSFHPNALLHQSVDNAAALLWSSEMRYVGIGAMLFAGIWTFIKLVKPLLKNISVSMYAFDMGYRFHKDASATDKDIPLPYILMGIILMSVLLFLFFQVILPVGAAGLEGSYTPTLVFISVLYVLIAGFLFSVIMGYLSGMVGVSASPGSSVVIAGMLFAASGLLALLNYMLPLPLTSDQMMAAEAITIIIGSVVTGIAAIANDNMQDLKVGQLVGSTPWRQEVMLLLGVLVASLVIPPVMQLLFDVYGIAGVMPREGMDITQSLPAPTGALMAAITEAVFRHTLPWHMMLLGVGIILLILVLNHVFKWQRFFRLSVLGVAIGMYLPMTTSFPLFFGGVLAWFIDKKLAFLKDNAEKKDRMQRGVLIACGLVAGSALMDVFLAIIFSVCHSSDALQIVGHGWSFYGVMLGFLSLLMLSKWLISRVWR